MSAYRKLAAVAELQHGVVSLDQARGVGFTDHQIRRLVQGGRLIRPTRGAFLIAGCPATWEQAVMMALAAAGDAALASHQTAAYLWNLIDLRPDRIEVVMPRWDRSIQTCVVHESTDLAPEDADRVGGIPVTSAVRTVVDLGATVPWLVEAALERGIRQRAFNLSDIAGFVARVGRRGRRGVGTIRPLLAQRLQWDSATESELEDLFRKAWSAPGRLEPLTQYRIEDCSGSFVCRADFAFPDAMLRIELDSEAHHMDRPTFRKDRSIQNRTELLGWRTLRYTWWDLTTRPAEVVREVAAALG
ncbi:MAG: type IV toxin-antitoxin system AbiEi family antitoxin domain-containing protein [Acidimicrobiia bacterium]|nr:type IV toxin-antitoxin system AbiEi family antitoxin domain-containing protein [Acidimicrobiia bacterium]MDH3397100.1 type IV toxin-antitoxin system AbiEi family antitoxin domain-containing protein [Acidimicrobiia bacterium]MDH5615340.1 type IV toxin-antitoxin system AbiEi family antitoxin domain-containing protein [Acidimicrobiia bacterium]